MKPKQWNSLKLAFQAGISVFIGVGVTGFFFGLAAGSPTPRCTFLQDELNEIQQGLYAINIELDLKYRVEKGDPRNASPKELEVSKRIKETLPELQQMRAAMRDIRNKKENEVEVCNDTAQKGFDNGLVAGSIAAGVLASLYVYSTKPE